MNLHAKFDPVFAAVVAALNLSEDEKRKLIRAVEIGRCGAVHLEIYLQGDRVFSENAVFDR